MGSNTGLSFSTIKSSLIPARMIMSMTLPFCNSGSRISSIVTPSKPPDLEFTKATIEWARGGGTEGAELDRENILLPLDDDGEENGTLLLLLLVLRGLREEDAGEEMLEEEMFCPLAELWSDS